MITWCAYASPQSILKCRKPRVYKVGRIISFKLSKLETWFARGNDGSVLYIYLERDPNEGYLHASILFEYELSA